MADTTMPDAPMSPIWAFDPLNPGPGFSLDSTFTTDEEMLYRSHFGFNDFDMASWSSIPEYPTGKTPAAMSYEPPQQQQEQQEPGHHGKISSRLRDFDTLTLDNLLRSTSQLAAERALYMNSPSDSLSSPGATETSTSQTDWEQRDQDFEFMAPATTTMTATQEYRLPSRSLSPALSLSQTQTQTTPEDYGHDYNYDRVHGHVPLNPSVPHRRKNNNTHSHQYSKMRKYEYDYECDDLTPLEMPDGSTRFTSNWLPVDPQAGFTIHAHPPASASATPTRPHSHAHSTAAGAFDLDFSVIENDYSQLVGAYPQNAFIELDGGA